MKNAKKIRVFPRTLCFSLSPFNCCQNIEDFSLSLSTQYEDADFSFFSQYDDDGDYEYDGRWNGNKWFDVVVVGGLRSTRWSIKVVDSECTVHRLQNLPSVLFSE